MYILEGQFLHTISAFEKLIGPLGLFHTRIGFILEKRKIHYRIMVVANGAGETCHK